MRVRRTEGDARDPRAYRVVYFTELEERDRDAAIARALAGEHVGGGYFPVARRDEAKRRLDALLAQLNAGQAVPAAEVEQVLAALAMLEQLPP